MRREGVENIITTGKINGKRDRGRQRKKIMDGLTRWHNKKSATGLMENIRK